MVCVFCLLVRCAVWLLVGVFVAGFGFGGWCVCFVVCGGALRVVLSLRVAAPRGAFRRRGLVLFGSDDLRTVYPPQALSSAGIVLIVIDLPDTIH